MQAWFQAAASQFAEAFDPAGWGTAMGHGLVRLMAALALFGLFYLGWRVARALLRPTVLRRLDPTGRSFAETVLRYGILIVGAVQALDVLGVRTATLLASIGIVGLTIGFAARDALSNLISGILIFLDRPFTIGDLVEIDGAYGRVDRITLRSTRIVTPDGRMLAVPNSQVIGHTVASYTNFPHLRLDVSVGVGVGEDLERARALMLGVVAGDSDYLEEPAPRVVLRSLGDFNVVLELQAWLDDERRHVDKRFELRERVFRALSAAGVDMPFETIRVAAAPAAPR